MEGVSRLHTEAFEEELPARLAALNHERAAEEQRGLIRWLRPEYQCPVAATAAPVEEQTEIALPSAEISGAARPVATVRAWPETLPEQVSLIRSLVAAHRPGAKTLSALFGRTGKTREDQIAAILETLRVLGIVGTGPFPTPRWHRGKSGLSLPPACSPSSRPTPAPPPAADGWRSPMGKWRRPASCPWAPGER